MNKAPTLRDVAQAVGVSPYTVSAVLNGAKSNTRVSEATRERILSCARALNYQPNAMAQGLVKQRTNTIGVFFSIVRSTVALANPYASSVLQGIVSEAAEHGYAVLLHTEDWINAADSAPRIRARRTDGTIVVAPLTDTDVVRGLAALQLPLVAVSAEPESCPPHVPNVDVDNRLGIQMAVDHLVGLGHRRIYHLMGNGNVASVRMRREAFIDAMARHGLPVLPEQLIECSYDGEAVYEALPPSLKGPNRPTALVAGNDRIALAALAVCRQLGLSVPADISIVGFDDIAAATAVSPPLTTLRQPTIEIGREAVRLLRRQFRDKNSSVTEDTPVSPELPPILVVRATTAPVSPAHETHGRAGDSPLR